MGLTTRTRPVPGLRCLLGRFAAGPSVEDAVGAVARLADAGRPVALEHHAPIAELPILIERLHAAGLTGTCELTLPVGPLEPADAERLAAVAADAGLAVALDGRAEVVDALAVRLPGARIVVPAGDDGAERRCRLHAQDDIRLRQGSAIARNRTDADLAFVRCLNVLLAGPGRPAVAVTDPTLIAIAGERAAWYDRPTDSWEYVMPWGVRTDAQARLAAAGYRVRVAVPSGPGALAALARRLGVRS